MAASAGGGASPGGGAALEEECEVVRVRVKKNEGQQPPEFRSFAVDPQITSLDVLQHILARAFDLQGKKSFVLSFAARDGQGQDAFVPLLSDGDLANAFACARPTLRLRLDVRNPPESPLLEDWDIISPREVAAAEPVPERRSLLAAALPFTQALLAQVGRTLARAQAALAWPEGSPAAPPAPPPPCAPLGDADLRAYLGPGGRLLRPQELRLHVFHGGVEPGLRKVVWRYLLNVFPAGLTGQERLSHLRLKAAEYSSLKVALAARAAPAELAQVAAAVRKDVVRTDRAHPYFGGPEEGHPHLAALQALLTTFALGHPRLSYCQGMSDVAAPLLAVLDDEAQAFLCFCSLMRRLAPRFRPGGRGLARAFAHLRRLLRRADPPFWAFLAARGAHDLLFCYRWLLLELKREFAFDDALKVLEITWSSLPPAPPPPPEGVPLLGAPLGARRAGKGLRERRGLRPRPPRRRRRRRREEDGADGGLGALGAAGDGPEGPQSSGEIPDGPQSPAGSQGGLEASPGGPESSGGVLESPRSSSDVVEGPKDSQEGPGSFKNVLESPRDSQEGPRSSSEVLEGPRDSQEGPKSFKNILEGPKDSQEGPRSFKNILEGPESSSDVLDGPRSPSDVLEGPKDNEEGPGSCENILEGAKDSQEGPGSCENILEGAESSSDVPRSSRKVQGRPPGAAGEAPEGSKEPEPGGPRKVEEGTDALEMEQRPRSLCWGAGGHPGEGRGGPGTSHDGPRGGHSNPGDGHREPRGDQDTSKDGHQDPRGGHQDPKDGHQDPRGGHDTSNDGHRDPKDDHRDPKDGHDTSRDDHRDPTGDHRDPSDDHRDPRDDHQDAEDGHPNLNADPEQAQRGPKPTRPNPPSPEDPWGGRWAWEDPSSSSSSSSCSSSSSSSSDEEVTVEDDGAPLPPPEELGQGNPFLLFVCLAMLLEQREAVMARAGDYNEVAMHFDRLVRRHQLPRVLRRAKGLFARYLEGWGGPQAGPASG